MPFFVAIPLPITGGWTAAKAFPLISLEILIAVAIVLSVSHTGIALKQYFGWQALLGAIAGSAVIYFLYKIIKNNNNHKKYKL